MAIVVKFSVAPFIFLYDLCSLIKKYYTCVNLYYSTRICTLFWQITTFTKIYQKQRPYVLLWMLWFYEKVYLMYLPSIYFFPDQTTSGCYFCSWGWEGYLPHDQALILCILTMAQSRIIQKDVGHNPI